MGKLADYEYLTFAVTLAVLWLAVEAGAWIARRAGPKRKFERGYLGQATGASITILALIVGFSFSAAMDRYNQRKSYEQQEASAISSEYSLARLLPAADAAQMRALLVRYIELRIAFFETADRMERASIRAERLKLESELWPIVERNAGTSPTPIMGQVVAGLNAVTSQSGYSQAAALDRIPNGTWTLMAMLAVICCVLMGYDTPGRQPLMLRLVLPLIVALAFFMISSLDAQRRGVIRVHPENLLRLQEDLKAGPKQ
ncbi:hypothetical protein [Terracidiphilus sp.]|jgi:hypothetical protein|uniref:bestrophin-like domain n=1 Tax=Terracidiphilus sp. TaxID=1964191 RepID=UPI003C1E5D23